MRLGSRAPAERGMGTRMGSRAGCAGASAASPPPCNRCFRRVRQRQSACRCREKIRRTPSGAGKISPSICVPPARPRPVSRPLRQSGKRHQRRRAAASAAQPADPSKVAATSGSARRARAPPGAPPAAVPRSEAPGARKGRSSRHEAEARWTPRASLLPALGPRGLRPSSPHHSSP